MNIRVLIRDRTIAFLSKRSDTMESRLGMPTSCAVWFPVYHQGATCRHACAQQPPMGKQRQFLSRADRARQNQGFSLVICRNRHASMPTCISGAATPSDPEATPSSKYTAVSATSLTLRVRSP
ncbi:hypothetical protein AB1N83_009093 [Pleurotus pulmonarius]